jgi:hypothetical protein
MYQPDDELHAMAPDTQPNGFLLPFRTTHAALLLLLEVVQQHTSLRALLAPVLYDDARAVDDLARIALAVQHAKPGPFAQLLAVGHLDERDLVLRAQRHHQLLVRLFLARFVQHTHVRLAPVEGFGGFAQATGKPVMD